MKKLAALILALLVCMTAVASAEVTVSDPGVMPIVTEPLTLTVWCPSSNDAPDFETNTMTLEYEKLTGIHIDWVVEPNNEATTKLNLEIAGKSYRDIYTGVGFSTDQVLMCIEGGVFRPLNEFIDNGDMPNFKARLEENPNIREWLTAPDGNIYTLYITDVGVHMRSQNKMFVYEPWLKAYKDAGFESPRTTEEFRDMLQFFKDNDMNGNGDNMDEIPLVSSYSAWCGDPLGYLMNPFQLYNANYYTLSDSKEVQFIANTEGWREGLRYIHSLYEQGLLDETTYVQDATQLKAVVNKGGEAEHIVGCVSGAWQGVFVDATTDNWTDYVAVEPLEGPTGLKQAGASDFSFSLRCAISTQCENPRAAAKWLDWWMSDEGAFANSWGMVEGTDYVYDNDTESFAGTTPSVVRLQGMGDGGAIVNYRWGANHAPKHDSYNIRYAASKDETQYNTNNTYVLVEAAKPYEPYYVNHNIPPVNWCSDTDLVTEVAEMRTLIGDFISTASTEFILGVRDIDADWDGYVAELDNMGLEHYIEILTEYYK